MRCDECSITATRSGPNARPSAAICVISSTEYTRETPKVARANLQSMCKCVVLKMIIAHNGTEVRKGVN